MTVKNKGKVILLGGSGFIGKELSSLLKEKNLEYLSLSSKELDLTKVESVSKLNEIINSEDVVVFLSCLTPDKGKGADAFLKNIQMGYHFCKLDSHIKFKQLVYISSDAVYGFEPDPINEETKPAPMDLYGSMHLSREMMFSDFSRERKINYSIARPVAIFGTDDTHNSYGPNRFLKTAKTEGLIKLFGEGEEKRDHIYAKDVAYIIFEMIERNFTGVLNLAQGLSLPFGLIANSIKDTLKGTIKIEYLNRQGPITHKHFDNNKLLNFLPKLDLVTVDQYLKSVLKK